MASPNVHPEFGYLCVQPRLRRDLRVACYSILFGAVIGAGAIIALGAGGKPGADESTDGRAATSTPAGETAPLAKAEATPAATVKDVALSRTGNLDASKTESAGTSDTAPADAGKNDAAKNDVTKSDATNTACGDGVCARRDPASLAPNLAPKPRRVRVRDATDGAALAGVPLGRATPAEVTTPSAPAANPIDPPQAVPAGAAEAPPDNATAAPAAAPVAAPKKRQKSARSQNRRRDEAAEDFLWRNERADGGRGDTDDWSRSRRRDVADEDDLRRGDYSAREDRPAHRAARGYGDDGPPRRGFGRERGPALVGPLGGLFGAMFGGGF